MSCLEDCNKDTPEFSLCGLSLKGKIVECYDADTCKIALPLQNVFYKFTCRLNGIDTPEMKPHKDKPNRDAEILWAKKARAELLKMICDNTLASTFDNLDIKKDDVIKTLEKNKKLVTVKCLEFDKYGRLLVELYNDNNEKSFNIQLVEKNLAVSYDGGHKHHEFNNTFIMEKIEKKNY
jgi:endonuclease YncB( thermonuclease family)